MEGHVDVAIAFGFPLIFGDRLAQGLPLGLQAEGKDGGVSTDGGRARAGLEIVGHDDAGAARLVEMDVAVDTAGHDQQAGGIDDLRRALQLTGKDGDAAARYPDIGLEAIRGRDDGAALDDRVQLHFKKSR